MRQISKNSMGWAGLVLLVSVLQSTGCGPRGFTKGEYDDPERIALLDDKFNESDMQQMADTTIKAMVACPYVAKAEKPPMVVVERVQNRTEEHIDTVALTDMVRTALIKTGKVRFVNKTERGTIKEELDYHESGAVLGQTAKKKGREMGADYILSGALMANVQEVGRDKLVYYKLTMNLTNLEAGTIDCTEEKQIRKKYEKQRVSD